MISLLFSDLLLFCLGLTTWKKNKLNIYTIPFIMTFPIFRAYQMCLLLLTISVKDRGRERSTQIILSVWAVKLLKAMPSSLTIFGVMVAPRLLCPGVSRYVRAIEFRTIMFSSNIPMYVTSYTKYAADMYLTYFLRVLNLISKMHERSIIYKMY